MGPAAKKMITENNLDIDTIKSSGKDDRVTKADVINHLEDSKPKSTMLQPPANLGNRPEKRVPMSRL